jgi:hypothetical protein
MNINCKMIEQLPQDILNHIGAFYITQNMKFLCRIDKMNKKVE